MRVPFRYGGKERRAIRLCGGRCGAQGVVAGGLWVRCGRTGGGGCLRKPRRASLAWTKSCVTLSSIFIGVATSHCRIGVQDGCQSRRLHAADLLEIAKSQVARVASTRKTVPRRHTRSSNQKSEALDARAYRGSAGLSNFGFFLGIFFQVAIQAGPADAQYLCGAQAISLAHIED